MRSATSSRGKIVISLFVIVWACVFLYESLRHSYLGPWLGRPLPKLPLLYPPAGWIMFFQVDKYYGFAEVYVLKSGSKPEKLDPHAIFATRGVGYDNIHRNMLVSVLDSRAGYAFCGYLRRKFPDNGGFVVVHAAYPDLIAEPDKVIRQVMYRCGPPESSKKL